MATPSKDLQEGGDPAGGAGEGGNARLPARPHASETRKRYLTLAPLGANDIPWAPEIASSQSSAPPLDVFASSLFKESKSWNDDEKLWKRLSGKDSTYTVPTDNGAKNVKVESLRRDEGKETWFMRKSLHPQKDSKFEHLEYLLRVDHGPKEADAMPAVFRCNKVLAYDLTRSEYADAVARLAEEGWHHVTIDVVEMFHHISPIPGLLSRRVFTQLVVTAISVAPGEDIGKEFVVVQLPIDHTRFPSDFWEQNSAIKGEKYKPEDREGKETAHWGKDVVRATYASVEKVIQTVQESGEAVNVWTMSTTSNAKGNLPLAIQKPSIPGQINHDVKLILEEAKKFESGGKWPAHVKKNVERGGVSRQGLSASHE